MAGMQDTAGQQPGLHRGHCRCGCVRLAASAQPHFSTWCHCDDCRRSCGAPAVAFVGFFRSEATLEGETLARYGNAPVHRLFCARCGSPVGYEDERLADRVYFYTGFMDEPERYPPTAHAYVSEQLPWLVFHDGLPTTEKTLVERPEQQDGTRR